MEHLVLKYNTDRMTHKNHFEKNRFAYDLFPTYLLFAPPVG